MKGILGLFLVLAILVIIPAADYVFAAGDEPGGYIDRGESVKDGARRELFEETFNLFHLNKKAFQTFFTQNNPKSSKSDL